MSAGPEGAPALAPQRDTFDGSPWRPSRMAITHRTTDTVRPGRGRVALPALASGLGLALSLPPWGFWVLAFPAAGLLWWRLGGLRPRTRLWAGWLAGLGCYIPGLAFARSFTLAGALVLIAIESLFVAVACLAVPRGPAVARALAFPAAMTLAEAVRQTWPFGGLPIGGVFLGQAGGPLLGVAASAAPWVSPWPCTSAGWPAGRSPPPSTGPYATGTRIREFDHLRETAGVVREPAGPVPPTGGPSAWRGAVAGLGTLVAIGVIALGALVGLGVVGAHAPDGGPSVGTVTAAAVQGGGVRGFSKSQVDPAVVLAAAMAATEPLTHRPPGSGPQLVLWPEDVVSLDGPLDGSAEETTLARLAVALHATLVVGVTETLSASAFRNEVVAFGPDGTIVSRYEKVHRVPFGEYVPWRSFFSKLGNLSAVPRDAVPGTGTGLLTTPAGPLGAMISYEVFYADRDGRRWRRRPAPHRPHQHFVVRRRPDPDPGDRGQRDPGRAAGPRSPPGRPHRLLGVDHQSGRPDGPIGPRRRAGGAGRPPPPHRDHPVRPLRRRPGAGGLAPGTGRRLGTGHPTFRPRAGPAGVDLLVVAGVDVHAGDAHGVEHGEIVGVVLEGQPQVESEVAQLVDGVPLVPGHLGVVPPGPHDQQVPAQFVALQPGQRLGLYTHRATGEQDDLELGVEQLEDPCRSAMTASSPHASKKASQLRRPRSMKCWRPTASDNTPSTSKTTASPGSSIRPRCQAQLPGSPTL